jgi:hypothetical protein
LKVFLQSSEKVLSEKNNRKLKLVGFTYETINAKNNPKKVFANLFQILSSIGSFGKKLRLKSIK